MQKLIGAIFAILIPIILTFLCSSCQAEKGTAYLIANPHSDKGVMVEGYVNHFGGQEIALAWAGKSPVLQPRERSFRVLPGLRLSRVWGGWSSDGLKLSLLVCSDTDPRISIEHIHSHLLADPYVLSASDFRSSDQDLGKSLVENFESIESFPSHDSLWAQIFWFCNATGETAFEKALQAKMKRVIKIAGRAPQK